MNTFTSHDLKADAFPQVGVDPLDVQRVDRESALVPPMACKCGHDKACGCQCCGPRGTDSRDVDDLRAQVTRLEAELASRGTAADWRRRGLAGTGTSGSATLWLSPHCAHGRDLARRGAVMAAGGLPTAASAADTLGRPLRDLRISVTDRCQFRCTYCMPREIFGRDFAFLPREDLLTFEELTRLGRVFAGLGVRKLRLTGGEPLLRRDLERLVAMLAGIDGVGDIALTTNGALLARKAWLLAAAGLRRVTVSLDSLDDAVFMALNDAAFPVAGVLDAIAAAAGAGLPVKVNMVVKRGCNDQSVLPMAEHFRGSGHVLRFIEFMDVGTTNGWRLDDVVPAAEIIALIGERWSLEPLAPSYPGEVACRYRYRDGGGEIGVIASVTQPFCGGCTRARLSAEGSLYTCLFAGAGHDLRGPLRGGASDEALRAQVASAWTRRADRYSELRSLATRPKQKVEMSHIGG